MAMNRAPAAPLSGLALSDQSPQPQSPAPALDDVRAAVRATTPQAPPDPQYSATPAGSNAPAPAASPQALSGSPSETVIRATAPMDSEHSNPPASPPNGHDKVRELHSRAAAKYDGMQDYVARFRRREFANGKQQPEDLMLMRFRKNPFSIYFKWLEGTANEGREILFVKGMYNNQMQVKTGKGDFIAGMRMTIDPNSARATANSRRTIEEAGIGNMIARFTAVLSAHENGAKTYGTLQYLGAHQRPESPQPLECVVQAVPGNVEKHLPRGGQRFWFFNADPQAIEFGLPILIITLDENRREVEYYCHDRFNINVCHPQDFDPDAIWAGHSKRR